MTLEFSTRRFRSFCCSAAILLGSFGLFGLSCNQQLANAQAAPSSAPQDRIQSGVAVPDGFKIEKVLSDGVATNIFCMATNPAGEIFVSGPGYIRRLIDSNDDGVFESSDLILDGPKTGAQGMWFDESMMLFVGDGALWKVVDANLDGLANDKPTKVFEIKTGGEHDAHAIRKGHDGWFYILAGNNTPILTDYLNGEFSPIMAPANGFLMRCSADFKTKELVAQGFRNAYDFDFNSDGEIFVYDSDGERDISLPWYRPTRVYKIQPGDDAGWISKGWKRPSYYFDMPHEIGAFGRGSPTGVENYSSSMFPKAYADAVFVADWTFGRVHVLKRDQETGTYDRGSDFAISNGQFGFAVTDLAVSKDGSLLISTGGRGTAGAIYRVSYQNATESNRAQVHGTSVRLSSPFNKRTRWNASELNEVLAVLGGDDSAESLVALECLVGHAKELNSATVQSLVTEGLRKNLKAGEPERLKLVYRIAREMELAVLSQVDQADLPEVSKSVLALASARNLEAKQKLLLDLAPLLHSDSTSEDEKLILCRVAQLVVGGAGAKNVPEMFKGYSAKEPIEISSSSAARIGFEFSLAMTRAEQIGDRAKDLSFEIGRLAALLKIESRELQTVLAGQINDSSSPVDDIHWLNCIANTGPHDWKIGAPLANSLVKLDKKLDKEKLNTDRNWIPRMRDLAKRLFQKNRTLAEQVAMQIEGRDGEVFLYDELPGDLKRKAGQRFFQFVSSEDDWDDVTPNQLRVIAELRSKEGTDLIRELAESDQLLEPAILALAKDPLPSDRPLFRDGLKSWNSKVIKQSASALRALSVSEPNADEIILAYKVANRIGWTKQDVSLRDHLIRLIEQQTRVRSDYEYGAKKEQTACMRQWGAFLQSEFRDRFEALVTSKQKIDLVTAMNKVDWAQGDIKRGAELYRKLNCAQCHDGGSRLGPMLSGVASRFGRDDLFRSIVDPSAQIPDRYRATVIATMDGKLHKGVVIYQSVDGITLQDVDGTTIRVNELDIESKKLSRTSLMPTGMLDEVPVEQWADLYAYLKSL